MPYHIAAYLEAVARPGGLLLGFDSTLGFPGEGPARRHRPWRILSMNCTVWSSGAIALQQQAKADVALIQEHHLSNNLANEEAWSRKAGWKMKLSPARCTGEGGTEGGVGIATLPHFGLSSIHQHDKWLAGHRHRAAAMHFGGVLKGGIMVLSTYLQHSVGMSPENWSTLLAIGETVRAMDRPFVIGGDFNMSPEELERSGWVQAIGGTIVRSGQWTCRYRKEDTEGNELDYFVVDSSLAPWAKCHPTDDLAIRPHRGVYLDLAIPKGQDFGFRMLKHPKGFPNERPIGCPPPTPVLRRSGEGGPEARTH